MRPDEQFDLAAWFLSQTINRPLCLWLTVGFNFDISFAIEFLLVFSFRGCYEVDDLELVATDFYFIVGMYDEL